MSAAEAKILESRAPLYTDYSAEQKAQVLALVKANGSANATAQQTGIPRQTIDFWVKNSEKYANVRQIKELDLASKLESNAHMLADSIAEHDLSIVPLQAKATALGITIDKMQLLRGNPTSIVATLDRGDLLGIMARSLDVIDVEVEP